MSTIMRIRAVSAGWQGAPGLFTMYARGAANPPVAADVTDMVARVRAFFLAQASNYVTTQTIQVSGTADLINDIDGKLVGSISVAAPAVVGGLTAAALLPIPSMLVLRVQTSAIRNGRKLQGRSFLGPVQAGVNVAGAPAAATLTTLIANATVMLTGTTASKPVVWGRPIAGPLPLAGSSADVTSYGASPLFGVLRSRRD
jgi:hypothetical protein